MKDIPQHHPMEMLKNSSPFSTKRRPKSSSNRALSRDCSLLAQIILVPSVAKLAYKERAKMHREALGLTTALHSTCQKHQLPESQLKSPGSCSGHAASPGTWQSKIFLLTAVPSDDCEEQHPPPSSALQQMTFIRLVKLLLLPVLLLSSHAHKALYHYTAETQSQRSAPAAHTINNTKHPKLSPKPRLSVTSRRGDVSNRLVPGPQLQGRG